MNTSLTAHGPQQIGFSDLVDAYFDEITYRPAAKELAEYHGLRLRVLTELFGCSGMLVESSGINRISGVAQDRSSVQAVARACLERHAAIRTPFGVYCEGQPGPMEQGLRDRHIGRVSNAICMYRGELRETFAECLRILYPGIEKKTVHASALTERGVPLEGPDPLEFW